MPAARWSWPLLLALVLVEMISLSVSSEADKLELLTKRRRELRPRSAVMNEV